MLNHHILFISGWGTHEDLWTPIKKELGQVWNYAYLPWQDYVKDNQNHCSVLPNWEGRITLISWSLGSLIALQAALELPHKIAHLILLSPTARMLEDKEYLGIQEKRLKAMMIKIRQFPEQVIRDFMTNCIGMQKSELLASLIKMANSFSLNELGSGLTLLQHSDLRNRLSEIQIPTLLIHGANDTIIPLSQAQYMNRNLPHSSLMIFRASHALPVTHAKAITQKLKAFLC